MKNNKNPACSLKIGNVYNYRAVKRNDKDSGIVRLAKVGGKKLKYATIEYVDSKFDELNDKLNILLSKK
jgi:hypothetical protein